MSAMRPGWAKIIEKLHIWTYRENAETDLYIADNAWGMDYTDTWLSKWIHWLLKCQSRNGCTTNYWCKEPVEFDTGYDWVDLLIMTIHPRVAEETKIRSTLTTVYTAG
jgi:hypothetical protein